MTRIRLEFESLSILRDKLRWNIYFVLATEHPTDPDKMVLTVMPEPFIKMGPNSKNRIDFVPQGINTDGMIVLEREMPADGTIRVRTYLRHSRQSTRNAGEVLHDINKEFGDSVIETVLGLFGGTTPWIVLSKAAFAIVITILRKVNDRDLGFLSLDENFTDEFLENGELDRSAKFSTGDAELVWTWAVIQ